MLPYDVAADDSLLFRFQDEIAYLDRMQPSADEVGDDIELLKSKEGLLIVAWLWPCPIYESGYDLFEVISQEKQKLQAKVDAPSPVVDSEKAFAVVAQAFDRWRQRRREVVAIRFMRIIETLARTVDCSVEDVKVHLKWSAPLTDLDLERLLRGYTPFSFPLIVTLCKALQLEFSDGWILVDPQRLARRIAQSVIASGISDQLHFLTLENLETVVKKLPRGSVNAERAHGRDIYRAPQPGGRYRSLYEALIADESNHPKYTLAEIDRVLVKAGELPLPVSATANRSWWAGSGAKPEGRPQVSAWWAAGYRIRKVAIAPSSGEVASIEFEALPGRAEWLARLDRTAEGDYRPPGPEKVMLYPDLKGLTEAMAPLARASEMLGKEINIEALAAALTPLATALERITELNLSRANLETKMPDDPNIHHLVEFLDKVGEANRSQIEHHFIQMQEKHIEAAWMTNLLTKARRQGWIVNNGTRRQPRWIATQSSAE